MGTGPVAGVGGQQVEFPKIEFFGGKKDAGALPGFQLNPNRQYGAPALPNLGGLLRNLFSPKENGIGFGLVPQRGIAANAGIWTTLPTGATKLDTLDITVFSPTDGKVTAYKLSTTRGSAPFTSIGNPADPVFLLLCEATIDLDTTGLSRQELYDMIAMVKDYDLVLGNAKDSRGVDAAKTLGLPGLPCDSVVATIMSAGVSMYNQICIDTTPAKNVMTWDNMVHTSAGDVNLDAYAGLVFRDKLPSNEMATAGKWTLEDVNVGGHKTVKVQYAAIIPKWIEDWLPGFAANYVLTQTTTGLFNDVFSKFGNVYANTKRIMATKGLLTGDLSTDEAKVLAIVMPNYKKGDSPEANLARIKTSQGW